MKNTELNLTQLETVTGGKKPMGFDEELHFAKDGICYPPLALEDIKVNIPVIEHSISTSIYDLISFLRLPLLKEKNITGVLFIQ